MEAPLTARLLIVIAVAAAIAYVMTPVAIRAARRFALYDHPAGYKAHGAPTPYLGGAAVMLAFALAVILGAGDAARTLPLLAGVAVLLVVGTIDDRRTVSPGLRVAVELALGAMLAAAGLGWKLGAGVAIDAAVTGIWVVAVVNAFNLFDNMDGAASTMALVVAAGACILALFTGDAWVAAGSAALCGACIGFLPHNLASPARIFLGDGGSMPLGFIVAALVANAARSAEPSSLALLVGLVLVGIPVLDTCLVIVSRRRRGISVLTGGQDHLTHRTRERMRTARRVLLVLGSTQALLSALVIFASRQSSATLVYIVLAFVVSAAAAIVALEEAISVPTDRPPPTAHTGDAPRAVVASSPGPARHAALACLGVIGLGAGLSPLFSAYYTTGLWVAIGLVLVVAAAAATIARPPRFTRPVGLALAGLAGLGLWSLLSASWAQAVEQATIEANRWLSYAALFLLVVVLLRGRRHTTTLLVSVGAGIAIVAASVLVRMLGSDPSGLFLGGRLNSPLGYVNGEACVFAMGCWLSLAVAERREPILAGLGAAATVALACLTLLSQSRGAAIATFVTVLVALAVIPGVRRRVLVLAFVGAGVAAAGRDVIRVYSQSQGGVPPSSVVHSAATAILAASAAVGLVWAVLVAVERAINRRGGAPELLMRRSATVVAACVLAVPAVAAAVRLPSIEHTIRTQWHAFVHVADTGSGPAPAASGTQTRLFSGAGNRYDYWRVGWHVFLAHPLVGVGAGNYTESYFRERRTTEAIQNPHSIELQTLSELGLIGAGLFAMLLLGVALGARRLRSAARSSPGARSAMVAATGVAAVWLVDTSGDWMHLLPGVSAIAIAAIAVLCRGGGLNGSTDDTNERGARLPTLVGAAALAFVLAVGGASLLRAGLTRHYLDDARAELAAHPAASIDDAGRALRLDSANLDAYYVKAAGLARFDRAAAARGTLLEAARQDLGNFVTWTLLGDLEVRVGDIRAAKAYYGRAHALDPHDPSLAALAADPRTALSGGAGR
jgi:UDP-GlcNAc:undecaprenyl-phosphate GlcNAc-1-phosphate transferase